MLRKQKRKPIGKKWGVALLRIDALKLMLLMDLYRNDSLLKTLTFIINQEFEKNYDQIIKSKNHE